MGLQRPELDERRLQSSSLKHANLAGTTLNNANLQYTDFNVAVVDSTTLYNQWTRFPDDFDAHAAGLHLVMSVVGDVDANDQLDVHDVDVMEAMIRGVPPPGYWPTTLFDLNHDQTIDGQDLNVWVHDVMHTWFGDANLDGEFDSHDVVAPFAAGKYEDDILGTPIGPPATGTVMGNLPPPTGSSAFKMAATKEDLELAWLPCPSPRPAGYSASSAWPDAPVPAMAYPMFGLTT